MMAKPKTKPKRKRTENRVKCLAGKLCKKAISNSKTSGEKAGRKLLPKDFLQCSSCLKFACVANLSCIVAFLKHQESEHPAKVGEEVSVEHYHSIAHALAQHFGRGKGQEFAEQVRDRISKLPDGLDPSEIGNSGRFNNWCSICKVNLGAFAFEGQKPGKMVCWPCAKPSATLASLHGARRLWSDR